MLCAARQAVACGTCQMKRNRIQGPLCGGFQADKTRLPHYVLLRRDGRTCSTHVIKFVLDVSHKTWRKQGICSMKPLSLSPRLHLTPRSRVLFDKTVVVDLVKETPFLWNTKSSLSYLPEPSSGAHPVPHASTPYPHISLNGKAFFICFSEDEKERSCSQPSGRLLENPFLRRYNIVSLLRRTGSSSTTQKQNKVHRSKKDTNVRTK